MNLASDFIEICSQHSNDIPALIHIMAWRRAGDKPLFESMMVSLVTHICVTRPQWVNGQLWGPLGSGEPKFGPVTLAICKWQSEPNPMKVHGKYLHQPQPGFSIKNPNIWFPPEISTSCHAALQPFLLNIHICMYFFNFSILWSHLPFVISCQICLMPSVGSIDLKHPMLVANGWVYQTS